MSEGYGRSVENMKDGDEFEMLLGEIPHATSSLNLHSPHTNAQNHRHNRVDHGYGHASCMTQKVDGHGNGHDMYDNEFLKHRYACTSSPVSGFSLQSGGSSSSLFSGGHSLSDTGSPILPQCEELNPQLISGNEFWLDFKKASDGNLVDELNLSRNFRKMYIRDGQEVLVYPTGSKYCDGSVTEATGMKKYGACDNYWKNVSDCQGFDLSVPRGPLYSEWDVGSDLMNMQHDQRIANLSGPLYSGSQPEGLLYRSDFDHFALNPQFYRSNVLASNNLPMGYAVSDVSSNLNTPSVGDTLYCAYRDRMNLIETRDAFYSPNVVQLARLMPQNTEQNLLHYQPPMANGRNQVPLHVRTPQGRLEAFTGEDRIIQGEGINYGMNSEHRHYRRHDPRGFHHETGVNKPHENRLQLESRLCTAAVQESCHRLKIYCPLSLKYISLAEVQGCIYHMAKDQHGCRFLQRTLDDGTPRDVQLILAEIMDHVVELVINPFGNYLMQKLLGMCNEEQRMHILLRVTEQPGELVKISLNTHGTRVVQKLVETLRTRQQASLVISALEPGFLDLIKDLNGNHVVQRCLQCFTNEDSKFIFIAAAKYSVEVATHQHGCCVLQRCIRHSTGKHQENLIAEISANGLLLAQDAFGNYVVQYILDLKCPSATFKLTSQFEGNYLHLSTQKFSSHVVEKCLRVCNDEARSKIIRELLSATYFEQLLQDPHANYVIQTAIRVSEGPILNSLIDAIDSHKEISRNSPYSKRIFSHKLLKK